MQALVKFAMAALSADNPVETAAPADSSTWETVKQVFAMIARIWDSTIFTIDNNQVKVSSLVAGLLALFIGLKLAKHGSSQLGKRVLTRFGMQQGAVIALQSIAHYALLVLLAMFVMNIIGIPLAALTVVGGAVALGIGFGSQNIVSNFISGLILLIERPIRVGDVIEIEGHHGQIERIGARSTQIRSSEGVDIIVPNSALLDKTVINWTYGDDFRESTINIGVAYGSTTETVRTLLLQAATEHPQVVKERPPNVLFSDFGDNALLFKLQFCVHMKQVVGREQIESDLRFRIDELFRAAKISLPFPQRDVHIDVAAPIDVRLAKT